MLNSTIDSLATTSLFLLILITGTFALEVAECDVIVDRVKKPDRKTMRGKNDGSRNNLTCVRERKDPDSL